MKKKIFLSYRVLFLLLGICMLFLSISCATQKKQASQKKTSQAQKEAEARRKAEEEKRREVERAKEIEREKERQIFKTRERLRRIAQDKTISVEDKKRMLEQIRSMNLQDSEINQMIADIAIQLAKEEERVMEEDANLNVLLSRIAQAPSTEIANQLIERILHMFKSDDTPVLVVISKYGDNEKDYDEPTTIKNYLNYIKDTRQYNKKVETIEYDQNSKKIKLLELIKR